MEINDKYSLLNLVNIAIKDKHFAKKEVLEVIREASEEFILKEGEILPKNYIRLFNNFQNIKLPPHKKMSQHIKFFKDYYKRASLEEQYILNNFIFSLEILNGNFKEGLKEFIIRTFSFFINDAYNNEYYKDAIDFIKDELITSDKDLIEIVGFVIKNFFDYDPFIRKSLFIHFLAILWNNKIMWNNKIWLSVFEDLVSLINECIQKERIEEEMYLHFYTYHIYGNNIQTIDEWREFNKLIEKPSSKFYKKWREKNNLPKSKKRVSTKKKKIGFLIDRIVLNSPWMVTYSLFKSLMENEEFKKNYEIYVYSMNYLDKQQDDENLVNQIKSLGIKYYSPEEKFIHLGLYYPHLDKALDIRNKIIEDKIDYLISGGGYDISNFIFSTRTAPKQILWSHGNCTSDIENIDLRISHFEQECKEFEWKIFNVPMTKEFLVGREAEKEKGLLIKKELLKEFGEDTIFLGTIGRLIKIESEEYLKVISKIMKENPNTIYLACGDGNIENIKKLMKKIGINLDKVIFPGMVNPHIFGWIIDVWINTYPLVQGFSQEEYHAKGHGVVVQGEFFIKNDFITDYEEVKNEFKNRIDFFLNFFELERLEKNINMDKVRFNLYKKYNKVNKKFENNIEKCIEYVYEGKNCKERWFRRINRIVNNKDFFELHRWIVYNLWKKNKALKLKENQFIKIIK